MDNKVFKLNSMYGFDIGIRVCEIKHDLHEKLSLHYECQQNVETKKIAIRLDCDIITYGDYKNKEKQEYIEKVQENNPNDADLILFLRDELQKLYLASNNNNETKYEYRSKMNHNYNWLVKYEFFEENSLETIATIQEFIEKTKPQLLERIEILKNTLNKV